jgi:deoxyadenosine kinase
MKKPNIIVHLDLQPEEALERIRMRSRDCETNISVDYLTSLHAAYEEFINEISRTVPVIKVDYSSFRTVDEMTRRILEEYEKIANIKVVQW